MRSESNGGASVAVVWDEAAWTSEQDAWWVYVTEVLDHVRLPYRLLSAADAPSAQASVIVVPSPIAWPAEDVTRLTSWVQRGGTLLVVGPPGDLAPLLGVDAIRTVEHGHVRVGAGQVWTAPPDTALHAVGGTYLRVRAAGVEVLASWCAADAPASANPGADDAAVTQRLVGEGVALACGVDLWQTIVRIQQGYPVTTDGEPAADGTAPIDDDILKCDDGIALSFEHDRALPPGQPGPTGPFEHVFPPPSAVPVFHRPQADQWRSVFLQLVWWGMGRSGAPVAWLSYWPAGVPAVAHMSHDADGNDDDDARAALDAFAEADVRVTWCQVFPGGYSPKIVAEIGTAGHEHALHFNARHDADIAEWGWPQMRAQYAWAQAVTGCERIVSNKNHYTRWEGWTQFYSWCERLGIRIDQTRGPSKQGDVGFPFGTAHLSFPIAGRDDGHRRYDVLNLPLHTQDLAWAAHEAVRDVILDGALSEHGVAHFLFHGPHLRKRPPTRQACVELANEARRRGMPWWTSEQLNEWERRRRGVDLTVAAVPGGWQVRSSATTAVPGAAILLSPPGGAAGSTPTVVDGDATVEVVRRHGRDFIQLAADLPSGTATWTVTV